MFLMPQDDYYLWFCDWCDSHNRTLWTKIEKTTITCAACHKSFPAYPEAGALHASKRVQHYHYQLL